MNCTSASLLVIAAALLAGCATPDGPPYLESKAQSAKPGYATLYIFREHAEPTGLAPVIQIDEKPVATLAQGGYTWVYAKPGLRRITATWSGFSRQTPGMIEVEFAEGNTYYVALFGTQQFRATEFGGGFNVRNFKMGSGFAQVPPESCRESTRKMLQPPQAIPA